MKKYLTGILDLAGGLLLVALCIFGTRKLLESRALVYLLFPSLVVVSAALGIWRGRASPLRLWQIGILLNAPLVWTVYHYASPRAPLLWILPLVATAFSVLGLRVARSSVSKNLRRTVILLPIVIVNVTLAIFVPRFVASFVSSGEVRESVSPFQMTLLAGGTVSTRELHGQIVILDFWATWCVPCRQELPDLDRVRERFRGRPGVVFYAVNIARGDTQAEAGDTPEQAREFLRRGGYQLTAAYDNAAEAQRALSISRLPSVVVLDRAGRVRLRHAGFVGSEDFGGKLAAAIERLLAESPV